MCLVVLSREFPLNTNQLNIFLPSKLIFANSVKVCMYELYTVCTIYSVQIENNTTFNKTFNLLVTPLSIYNILRIKKMFKMKGST